MKYYQYYRWKTYEITVVADTNNLLNILFGKPILNEYCYSSCKIIENTNKQLDEYFAGKRYKFNLPVKISENFFIEQVLAALSELKYGETLSYGNLADIIGHSKAFRAVGSACKKNPLPIIIPCHRVIKSNGEIGEYAGGVHLKRELLELESCYANLRVGK